MKKWLLIAACTILTMSAHAKDNMWCNYKDYFHLSDQAHPGIFIVNWSNEPDVYLDIVGPRSFVIRDTPLCRAGYAHVTVAYDNANWCVLDIQDGPFVNTPTVIASCNGMRYISTTYDGMGSYSYSINLD